jgi:hypothetical protein
MKRWITLAVVVLLIAAGWVLWRKVLDTHSPPAEFVLAEQAVHIQPDYVEVTIPPNIAPLNFRILEEGTRYLAVLTGGQDTEIRVVSSDGQIRIPSKPWKRMLAATAGGDLCVQIFVRTKVGWQQYRTFMITVATEPIDRYVTYRLLRPQFNKFNDVGIYQRDLESFSQREIIHGRLFRDGCVNCHQLDPRQPGTMLLGVRSSAFGSGTLLIRDGKAEKIGVNFGHTSWHPSGTPAAFSTFDVRMMFHTARTEIRDVVEFDSLISYFDLTNRRTFKTPVTADKGRLETQPSWSPDGRYLYFASAPKLWTDMERFPPDQYADLKYDIQRAEYFAETNSWGSIETVVAAKDTGHSCLAPRVSPDGRFLLFTMCDYGCFAIYQPSSDLYMLNLQSNQLLKLACNSEFVDSWHSWSSNSRWIVFSSKRPTGQFTRLYLSRIDDGGQSSKPFVLPQNDPQFYDSFLYAYNVPEMATWRIEIGKKQMLDAIRSPATIKVDAVTAATPKKQDSDPYRKSSIPVR